MISRDDRKRRIYSITFLYLVHSDVYNRMRDLFAETAAVISECKARAVQLAEAASESVDIFRLREPSNWNDFSVHVRDRAFRTAETFANETNEFIEMAMSSMNNLMPPHCMDFLGRVHADLTSTLRGVMTDDTRAALEAAFDMGAFFSAPITHPLMPITAPMVREALRNLDAVKVAQTAISLNGVNYAVSLQRVIEQELMRARRSGDSRSAEVSNRVPKDYLKDARLRERIADSTEEIDRLMLTWSAANAQRVAVYAIMCPVLNLLQQYRMQVNDAVAEVLRDPQFNKQLVLKLFLVSEDEHAVTLKLLEPGDQQDGDDDDEDRDEQEEDGDEYEHNAGYAAILGAYGDDTTRAIYEQASSNYHALSNATPSSRRDALANEGTAEELALRLHRLYHGDGEGSSLPTLAVRVVHDAIEATVGELVATITARRFNATVDDEAVVQASASILLSTGSRKRRSSSSSSSSAAAAAAAELPADPDVVAFTNAELLRALSHRDILINTLEERVFNCLVSPHAMARARQSSVLSFVRSSKLKQKRLDAASPKPTPTRSRAAPAPSPFVVSAMIPYDQRDRSDPFDEEPEARTAADGDGSEAAPRRKAVIKRAPTLTKLAFTTSRLPPGSTFAVVHISSSSDKLAPRRSYLTENSVRGNAARTVILHSADRR